MNLWRDIKREFLKITKRLKFAAFRLIIPPAAGRVLLKQKYKFSV